MFEPRPVGWGENLSGSGSSTIGDEKQRLMPRLSCYASGASPSVAIILTRQFKGRNTNRNRPLKEKKEAWKQAQQKQA